MSTMWRLLVVIATTAWTALTLGATLTASVDRHELHQDEHVVLTLKLLDSDTRLRAQGVDPNVDLTLLSRDFELGIPRVTHRFNIERNRGRSTSELTVELFPKHVGRARIPAFTIDGQHTAAITLRVLPATASDKPEVFLRSGLNKRRIWNGEQVLVYLDLYHRVALKDARLGGDLSVEPTVVDIEMLRQGERIEQVGGMRYEVTRSTWAFTPHQARDYALHLPDVWLETRDGRRLRLPFRDEALSVRPIPEGIPPGILMGRPTLAQDVAGSGESGMLIPWTLTLTAPAAPAMLPDRLPTDDAGLPPHLRLYAARGETARVAEAPGTARAVYHNQLVVDGHGDFHTPELTLPYFDTERGVAATLHLAPQDIHITPVSSSAPTPRSAPAISAIQASSDVPAQSGHATLWRSIAAVLAVLWLFTVALLLRRLGGLRRRTRRAPGPRDTSLKQRLLEVLDARTLQEGMDAWERRHGIDDELRAVVLRVQQAHYGRRKGAEDAALRAAVESVIARIDKGQRGPELDKDVWMPEAFTPRLRNSGAR